MQNEDKNELELEGSPLSQYKLRLYDVVFLTLGCSIAMEHAGFKVKYDKYNKTKFNETLIYYFKFHSVFNYINK